MYQCLAAIDIGSNTVHLIVAATDGQQLTILADESAFVQLAAGIAQQGGISPERIAATVVALLHLRAVAESFGASRILVAATEVARSAPNGGELLRAIREECGLDPLLLSGQDEATLTFLGVTHGRHLPTNVAVADLGGGSLEVILAELGHDPWRKSLAIGSSFMHDQFAPDDPPQPTEVAALRAYVAERLAEIPRLRRIEELLVSGGTINALMRLVQQLQHRASGDRILRRSDFDQALTLMGSQPANLVAADYHLRPERARLLPTGTVILAALLDHLHLPGLIVSPAGIREGMILAAANYGTDWLAGAHQGLPPQDFTDAEAAPSNGSVPPLAWQPTTDVLWSMLVDMLHELVGYRAKVLAGDADAVHDMRVLARRVRTLLETFGPCFPVQDVRRLNLAVRQLAHALGAVRDADVALQALALRLQEADPALVPGLRYLIKEQRLAREGAQHRLRRRLDKPRLERLRILVDALRLTEAQRVSQTSLRIVPPTSALPEAEETRHE